MARHNILGKWGEEIACEVLRNDGFAVVETNWRSGHNEIDIIAVKGDVMVFAEVKTRSDKNADPLEAIDNRKIARLARAADSYIHANRVRQNPRFDVFGISGSPDDYRIEHIPDAFYPPLQTYR